MKTMITFTIFNVIFLICASVSLFMGKDPSITFGLLILSAIYSCSNVIISRIESIKNEKDN